MNLEDCDIRLFNGAFYRYALMVPKNEIGDVDISSYLDKLGCPNSNGVSRMLNWRVVVYANNIDLQLSYASLNFAKNEKHGTI